MPGQAQVSLRSSESQSAGQINLPSGAEASVPVRSVLVGRAGFRPIFVRFSSDLPSERLSAGKFACRLPDRGEAVCPWLPARWVVVASNTNI